MKDNLELHVYIQIELWDKEDIIPKDKKAEFWSVPLDKSTSLDEYIKGIKLLINEQKEYTLMCKEENSNESDGTL